MATAEADSVGAFAKGEGGVAGSRLPAPSLMLALSVGSACGQVGPTLNIVHAGSTRCAKNMCRSMVVVSDL